MCFTAESPECFSESMRKARKEHFCVECGSKIQIGQMYQVCTGIWDGSPDSFKTCFPCCRLRDEVTEIEEKEGCSGTEAIPPFGYLWEAAFEMELVSKIFPSVG